MAVASAVGNSLFGAIGAHRSAVSLTDFSARLVIG
jgi:hypothetical protein